MKSRGHGSGARGRGDVDDDDDEDDEDGYGLEKIRDGRTNALQARFPPAPEYASTQTSVFQTYTHFFITDYIGGDQFWRRPYVPGLRPRSSSMADVAEYRAMLYDMTEPGVQMPSTADLLSMFRPHERRVGHWAFVSFGTGRRAVKGV